MPTSSWMRWRKRMSGSLRNSRSRPLCRWFPWGSRLRICKVAAPASRSATSALICATSSGLIISSASRNRIQRPRASSRPALRAAAKSPVQGRSMMRAPAWLQQRDGLIARPVSTTTSSSHRPWACSQEPRQQLRLVAHDHAQRQGGGGVRGLACRHGWRSAPLPSARGTPSATPDSAGPSSPAGPAASRASARSLALRRSPAASAAAQAASTAASSSAAASNSPATSARVAPARPSTIGSALRGTGSHERPALACGPAASPPRRSPGRWARRPARPPSPTWGRGRSGP